MAATSRKSRNSRSARRSFLRFVPFGPLARRRLGGSALLILGAASALSLLFPNGPATQALSSAMFWIAGLGGMAIPVGLLWAGAVLLEIGPDEGFRATRRQAAGFVVAILALLGLLHLLPIGLLTYGERAAAGQGGGHLGYLLIVPLEPNLGLAGTLFVLLLAEAGGLWAIGWPHLPGVRSVLAGAWSAFRAWREERNRVILINPGIDAGNAVRGKKPSKAPAAPTGDASTEEPAPQSLAVQKGWTLPPIEIFESVPQSQLSELDIEARAQIIEDTLRSFGVDARVVEANQGPAITQFGVEPGVGVKVARIMSLGNDLALRLAASPLRLEAPVPGKRVVGIEVPNGTVSVVCIRDLLESQTYAKHKGRLRLALGRSVSGAPVIADLTRAPHLLIAGATGSGKSVCLNSFIAALLFQCPPDELRMLMIDPKMVEMAPFNGIPHLLTPVVSEMDKVVPALKWVTKEMERRYRLFAARGARNIEGYNRAATGKGEDLPLPYIVVIVDELADLMMTAPDEVEKILCRLAQLARATGIHLVVATQRPSVDVVTGLIKANFPTRIAFAVTSQIDSRVILDQSGAEKLLGRGDMLYMPTDASKPVRLQGTYVSDGEILEVVDFWKKAIPVDYSAAGAVAFEPVEEEEADDLYEQAVEEVSRHDRVSTSFLQRRLKIGYNRAATLMELLEENGVVGSADGSKAREVLVREEADEEDFSAGD